MNGRSAGLAIAAIVLGLVPAILVALGSGYVFRIAHICAIYLILVVGLNLCAGTAGLLSFAHAAFFGVGAYVAGLLSIHLGWGFPFTALAAALAGALVGVATVAPLLRLTRLYFAVATLAITQIIHVVVRDWDSVTRGSMGLSNIGRMTLGPLDLSGPVATYYVVAISALAATLLIHRLTHSHFGTALRAVREDEACAAASGLRARPLRLAAIAASSAVAGFAGGLYAHTTRFLSPELFTVVEGALVLTCVVIGGLGSLPGAAIGTVLLLILPEVTRPLGNYRILAYGLTLLIAIVFLPRGLVSEVRALALVRRLGAAWRRTPSGPVGWR